MKLSQSSSYRHAACLRQLCCCGRKTPARKRHLDYLYAYDALVPDWLPNTFTWYSDHSPCMQAVLLSTSMYLPLLQHQTQVLLLYLDSLPSQIMDSQASPAVKVAAELKTSLWVNFSRPCIVSSLQCDNSTDAVYIRGYARKSFKGSLSSALHPWEGQSLTSACRTTL